MAGSIVRSLRDGLSAPGFSRAWRSYARIEVTIQASLDALQLVYDAAVEDAATRVAFERRTRGDFSANGLPPATD